MSSLDPVIGIVGAGYWGKNLVRDYYSSGHLRAICDKESVVLSRLHKLYPDIKYTTEDYTDLLEDSLITAIIISTPSPTHFELASKALKANKDCFIEKPMSFSVYEADKLIALAKEYECILMIGHILQYNPIIKQIYTMVADGIIGDIKYIRTSRMNTRRNSKESVLWSLGPHYISLIVGLIGMPISVSVSDNCYSADNVPDIATIILRFTGNRYANVYIDGISPYSEQKLTIVGTTNTIVFDALNKSIIYKKEQSPYIKSSPFGDKTPLQIECEMFINHCRTRTTPITDGYEGRQVVEILEAAHNSMDEGGSIQLMSTSYTVHPSVFIDNGARIGAGTRIWHYSHITSTAVIGKNCTIGQNCYIAGYIGDGCKVQNNVSIYDGVVAGDNVFFGPSCVLTNDINPRCAKPKHGKYKSTLRENDVTIGANATILCGITLGRNSMIGAGAVVVKPVLPGTTVVGNPAHIL